MSSLVFLVPNRLENFHDCRNSGFGVGLREQLTAYNAGIVQFLENVHDVFVADFACARLMTPRVHQQYECDRWHLCTREWYRKSCLR